MRDIFDDMLNTWLAFANYTDPKNRKKIILENQGLKPLISRPHNIYATRKDNKPDGDITSYVLEVVTTPFKKDEVKIQVKNDVLTVTCGNENAPIEASYFNLYKGISSQTFTFSIRLNKIDTEKITAKVEDGILRIIMPVFEDTVKAIDIAVS